MKRVVFFFQISTTMGPMMPNVCVHKIPSDFWIFIKGNLSSSQFLSMYFSIRLILSLCCYSFQGKFTRRIKNFLNSLEGSSWAQWYNFMRGIFFRCFLNHLFRTARNNFVNSTLDFEHWNTFRKSMKMEFEE